MSDPICVHGDFVIEVRSLLETPRSVHCSFWVREVGGTFCGGPFETFPDASRAALDMARRAGSNVWRESVVFMEDGTRSVLQLVKPAGARDTGPIVRDCA
jgi:hypothetical protein